MPPYFSGLLGFTGVVTYGISHLNNEPLKSLSRASIPNGWAYWLSVHGSLVLLVMGCINASFAAGQNRHVTEEHCHLNKEPATDTDSEMYEHWLKPMYYESAAVT